MISGIQNPFRAQSAARMIAAAGTRILMTGRLPISVTWELIWYQVWADQWKLHPLLPRSWTFNTWSLVHRRNGASIFGLYRRASRPIGQLMMIAAAAADSSTTTAPT